MTINAATYAFLNTKDEVSSFHAGLQITFDKFSKSLPKMPKAKALELLNATFPGYEATDVYTVKANLEAAYNATSNALNDRYDELTVAEANREHDEAAEAETKTLREEKIEKLLADYATADKVAKKTIRATIRRLGLSIRDLK